MYTELQYARTITTGVALISKLSSLLTNYKKCTEVLVFTIPELRKPKMAECFHQPTHPLGGDIIYSTLIIYIGSERHA